MAKQVLASYEKLGLNNLKTPLFLEKKLLAGKDFSNKEEINEAFEELKKYFWLGRYSHSIGKSLPMYSKKIDAVWHQFILFSREYMAFCNHFFGEYIHHAPEVPSLEARSTAPLSSEVLIKNRLVLREDVLQFKSTYRKFFGETHSLWGLNDSRFSEDRKNLSIGKFKTLAASLAISIIGAGPAVADNVSTTYTTETLLDAGVSTVSESGKVEIQKERLDELIESAKADGLEVSILSMDADFVEVQFTRSSIEGLRLGGEVMKDCLDPVEQCEVPSRTYRTKPELDGRKDPITKDPKQCDQPLTNRVHELNLGDVARTCLDPVEQCQILSTAGDKPTFGEVARACLDPVEQCQILSTAGDKPTFGEVARACLDPVEQCQILSTAGDKPTFGDVARACLDPVEQCQILSTAGDKPTFGEVARTCLDPVEQCQTPSAMTAGKKPVLGQVAKECLDPVEQCETPSTLAANFKAELERINLSNQMNSELARFREQLDNSTQLNNRTQQNAEELLKR